jgi:hypothetical protein
MSFGEPDAHGHQEMRVRYAIGRSSWSGTDGTELGAGRPGELFALSNGGSAWFGLAQDPFWGDAVALFAFNHALAERTWQPEPAGQLGRAQPSWQLEQGERVAVRFGHDPIQHRLIEPIGKTRSKQCPRIPGAQALDDHLGEPPELVRHLPGPEDERNSLGRQATRHEGDRLRGRPVEPLGVVDQAQQRPLRSHLGQQV